MQKTIVLFGGTSDERQVSVASAQNIARTVDSPICWFWATDGSVHEVSADELTAHQRPFENDFTPSGGAIAPDLASALDVASDAVFLLALHGGAGEDGTVQRLFEERGIPFTGSGADASAAAFDKGRAKEIVRDRVRMAESQIARSSADINRIAREMLERYDRIVLKPLAGGSSRGLFFLDHRSGDVDGVLAQVDALRVPYIIEQFVAGRELTVGVLDRGEGAFALAVIEIETDPGFNFDYAGKYLGKGTREICPAKIPESMRNDAQRVAVTAHEALGCSGYSRTDLVATPEGAYFLELNTLPGLTTSSLVPQELREAGITLREFLYEQIELAVRRAKKQARRSA